MHLRKRDRAGQWNQHRRCGDTNHECSAACSFTQCPEREEHQGIPYNIAEVPVRPLACGHAPKLTAKHRCAIVLKQARQARPSKNENRDEKQGQRDAWDAPRRARVSRIASDAGDHRNYRPLTTVRRRRMRDAAQPARLTAATAENGSNAPPPPPRPSPHRSRWPC